MARILLVEDQHNVRLLISTILSSQHHSTVTAEDGQQALDILKMNDDFDLLITDLRMPRVDGLQLIERVKQTHPTLCIIAMSAYHEDLEQAQATGADYLLTKPFSYDKLMEIIRGVGKG